MNRFFRWIKRSELTVCHELHRQGHLTTEEFKKDVAYGHKTCSYVVIATYKIVIIPIVLLMKSSRLVTKVVHKIAKKVWFDRFL